jgi:carbon-monoxide dehydrogenase small subunit
MFAVQADGSEITTIEGLASNGHLHPVQQAFWDCHALQCGYCTPGMIMTIVHLLAAGAASTREEIAEALRGNLCRCTGYTHIIDAVQQAATQTRAAAGHNRTTTDEARAARAAGPEPDGGD